MQRARPEYLTIKEAAALARVHYQTLYKLIRRGELDPAEGLIRRHRRLYLIKETPFRRVFIEGEAPRSKGEHGHHE